jgi:hypothetical protein
MRTPFSVRAPVLSALLISMACTADDLVIVDVPTDAPSVFAQHFSKYVDVMGVGVYATASSADEKVLHCARTLAQFIDNDENGTPDNLLVHQRMVDDRAAMVMWRNFSQAENSDFWDDVDESVADSLQDLMASETIPNWQEIQQFDAALEECFHLVNFVGYARVYPDVFGEQPGSQVAQAMDLNIANGYFHYDDPTCDYRCKIIEYTYWAMTSILGAQDEPWRRQEIADEWELYSAELVQSLDPSIHALLMNPVYELPVVLPDAVYSPAPSCTADYDGSGRVDGTDLSLLLGFWGLEAPDYDLDGNALIDGADLAGLLGAWGLCSNG